VGTVIVSDPGRYRNLSEPTVADGLAAGHSTTLRQSAKHTPN
jgi:hypothetical protein